MLTFDVPEHLARSQQVAGGPLLPSPPHLLSSSLHSEILSPQSGVWFQRATLQLRPTTQGTEESTQERGANSSDRTLRSGVLMFWSLSVVES